MFWVRVLLGAVIGLMLCAIAFGMLQNSHPVFDSLSHFRLHFAFISAFCAIALGLMNKARRFMFFALGLLLLGFVMAHRVHELAPIGERQSETLRVLQFNLYVKNEDSVAYLAGLTAIEADIILFQEVNAFHRRALASLKDEYPYQAYCVVTDAVDVAILSRRPLRGGECRDRFVSRRISFGGHELNLASIHLYWPWPHSQNEQISRLEGSLSSMRNTGLPVIIAGDFNAAPWSYAVERVRKITDTGALPGAPMTMRIGGILPVPIDHQLHSKALCPIARSVWPDALGSDHSPVIVDYRLGACER